MFCLNIALGHTSWRMLFKDEEKAKAAINLLETAMVAGDMRLADDYGQTVHVKMPSVHGWMLEDMDKTKLAHVEMALHQARTQDMANKQARNDPTLRASAAMAGPAMLSPMSNGFRQG